MITLPNNLPSPHLYHLNPHTQQADLCTFSPCPLFLPAEQHYFSPQEAMQAEQARQVLASIMNLQQFLPTTPKLPARTPAKIYKDVVALVETMPKVPPLTPMGNIDFLYKKEKQRWGSMSAKDAIETAKREDEQRKALYAEYLDKRESPDRDAAFIKYSDFAFSLLTSLKALSVTHHVAFESNMILHLRDHLESATRLYSVAQHDAEFMHFLQVANIPEDEMRLYIKKMEESLKTKDLELLDLMGNNAYSPNRLTNISKKQRDLLWVFLQRFNCVIP